MIHLARKAFAAVKDLRFLVGGVPPLRDSQVTEVERAIKARHLEGTWVKLDSRDPAVVRHREALAKVHEAITVYGPESEESVIALGRAEQTRALFLGEKVDFDPEEVTKVEAPKWTYSLECDDETVIAPLRVAAALAVKGTV